MKDTIQKVKERPILFSTPMVQAILEGRKTVTRRVIKESFNGCLTNGGPHPCPNDPIVIYPGETYESPCHPGESITVDHPEVRAIFHCSTLDSVAKCRQGKPGDILWVRETWFPTMFNYRDLLRSGDKSCIRYAADGNYDPKRDCVGRSWKPSIFMPRAACRIKLEILSIKVERLHDITEKDAIREGVHSYPHEWHDMDCSFPDIAYEAFAGAKYRYTHAKNAFEDLWESINGEDSWGANPWVWRIELKRL